jgi:hypothetical protein
VWDYVHVLQFDLNDIPCFYRVEELYSRRLHIHRIFILCLESSLCHFSYIKNITTFLLETMHSRKSMLRSFEAQTRIFTLFLTIFISNYFTILRFVKLEISTGEWEVRKEIASSSICIINFNLL